MKKILLSTIVLFAFSMSILLFQISCKKDVNAQYKPYDLPIASKTILGGVMIDDQTIKISKEGTISAVPVVIAEDNVIVYAKVRSAPHTIWKINVDGSQDERINITLPANRTIDVEGGGMKHFQGRITFAVEDLSGERHYLYSCNLDGSGLKEIKEIDSEFVME